MATISRPRHLTLGRVPASVWAAMVLVAVTAVLVTVQLARDPASSTTEVSPIAVSGPSYWEEINRQALTRVGGPDTSYADELERRAQEVDAGSRSGVASYYWEDITRQALERAAGVSTLADQIVADLGG